MLKFTVRGARGTLPRCGDAYKRYGGSTTCFSAETDNGVVVIDAGTGISHVAADLVKSGQQSEITILFSHFHMDHLIGLPSFEPFYHKGAKIRLFGDKQRSHPWETSLRTFIGKPFWPIGFDEFESVLDFHNLPEKDTIEDLYGLRISWFRVPHPQGCLSYKIEHKDLKVVFATDLEYPKGQIDSQFIDFCRNADILIHDAQYTEEEYNAYVGWGHSTPSVAIQTAKSAQVGKLIMTHHAPARTDSQIDEIENKARSLFPNTEAASENMVITLP